MEVFSVVKECFGCIKDCCDNGQPINVNVTIHNDREYFSRSRPRECRPEYTRQLRRKRSYTVG